MTRPRASVVQVGEVTIHCHPSSPAEVRRMLKAAASVALAVAKASEPEPVDKPALGFAAGELDPDR